MTGTNEYRAKQRKIAFIDTHLPQIPKDCLRPVLALAIAALATHCTFEELRIFIATAETIVEKHKDL